MIDSETWHAALSALRANKLKASLTTLGVVIGTASIVMVVTVALLSEGQLARAWILWSPAKNFQHEEALAALGRVLAARPTLERAHNRMATICMHIGRLEEGRLAHEQALRSNPRTRTGNLEYFYIYSGDFARAEELQHSDWPR